MADSTIPTSPRSQVLHTLGITREELMKHSEHMRSFLSENGIDPFEGNTGDSKAARSSSTTALSVVRVDREPSNPIKIESREPSLPRVSRPYHSMEEVMERKSRQARLERKTRRQAAKAKAHEASPSPAPKRPTLSLDSFMDSCDTHVPGTLQPTAVPTPVTPHSLKYYRDHTVLDPARAQLFNVIQTLKENFPIPQNTHLVTVPTQEIVKAEPESDLSSSDVPSSPLRQLHSESSPARPIYNTVSSPGPLRPTPAEADYDGLPYHLPPGPYSEAKPDLSYAAIIGRAILSSPEHRLALQDIYEWMTIVFPHFKRGENTWMNSVRHVLSTTACFRKVPKDKAVGRSLWAIWDEDLKCFENGGFNKQYCADIVKQTLASKKRSADEQAGSPAKKARLLRKARTAPMTHQSYGSGQTLSLPIFPPLRPSPHLQPYYETCAQSYTQAEIVFPPLPRSSYRRMASVSASSVASSSVSTAESTASTSRLSVSLDEDEPSQSPAPSDRSFSVSVPDLVPSHSSSPPSEEVSGTDLLPGGDELAANYAVNDSDFLVGFGPDRAVLEPKPTLAEFSSPASKGKQKDDDFARNYLSLSPIRNSPRSNLNRTVSMPDLFASSNSASPIARPSTPPRRPSTPIQCTSQLSPHRTPISHKGVYMSPNASLAHYRSNLDPPPCVSYATVFGLAKDTPTALQSEGFRTPSRKTGRSNLTPEAGPPFEPVTPRRLNFMTGPESPFRTPGSASRYLLDPHDPRTVLEEELNRIHTQDASPSMALFPRGGGFLYESPGVPSPSALAKWF